MYINVILYCAFNFNFNLTYFLEINNVYTSISINKHLVKPEIKILMSIFRALKRNLHSDPEYFDIFSENDYNDDEDSDMNDFQDGRNKNKTTKRHRSEATRPKNQVFPTKTNWKLVFELKESDSKSLKSRAHHFLDEIFVLTFNWPSGKFYTNILQIEEMNVAITRAFPFRNSIFNTPLELVPCELKCSLTQLPRVIIELMRFLGQSECLRIVGAFRVESIEIKPVDLEQIISSGIESSAIKLSNISAFEKMCLLKCFFRQIPGKLISKPVTSLFLQIFFIYEDSPCLSPIIRWLFTSLPLEHFKALGVLCLLLNCYAKHEKFNLMSAESLAICWGPIVFDNDFSVEQIKAINKLMTLFIIKWDKFFLYPLN